MKSASPLRRSVYMFLYIEPFLLDLLYIPFEIHSYRREFQLITETANLSVHAWKGSQFRSSISKLCLTRFLSFPYYRVSHLKLMKIDRVVDLSEAL